MMERGPFTTSFSLFSFLLGHSFVSKAPVGTTSLPPTAAPTGVEAVLPNTATPPENPYVESSAM